MRQIFLIARREYLSYVATWGFWLSLAMVPVFMSLGFVIPLVAERAAPTLYVAVIAQDAAYDGAVEQAIADRGRRAARVALAAVSSIQGDEQTRERALAAFDAAEGDADAALAAGLEAAGATGLVDPARLNLNGGKVEIVEAPARDPDGLRPYLLGERMVETSDGPRPLSAAAFIASDADGAVTIDVWSSGAALSTAEFRTLVSRAVRDVMRTNALLEAGVSRADASRIDDLNPSVRRLTPEREGADAEVTVADQLPYFMAFGLGIALWVVIFSVVNMLLTSTIEEKSNKVLETLLSTARLPEILFGKLLGVAAVSFTLVAVWGGGAAAALLSAAQAGVDIPAEVTDVIFDPGLLIPFAGYFVAGYLVYGAIFIAIGSLCETIQEAQTLMTPMILVLMVPMFALVIGLRDPTSPILAILSWVPLYTPFVMIQRMPTDPSAFELVGTSVLLAATTIGVVWAAGGVFRAGVVSGATPGAARTLLARIFGRRTA